MTFECTTVVGTRQTGLSISEIADLMGFKQLTISKVYREWFKKGKMSIVSVLLMLEVKMSESNII